MNFDTFVETWKTMTRIILIFLLFISCAVSAQKSDTTVVNRQDSTNFTELNKTKVLDPELDLIVPPVGFDTSIYFHGYVNLKKRSAIVMREVIDHGRDQVMQAANNDNFYQDNNLTFIDKVEFVSDIGTKGVYLKMSFLDKQNVEFTRFMVYSGNDYNTFVLDFVYPTQFDFEKDVLKCIQSIKYTR